MGSHDAKNVEIRGDRKRKHDERGKKENQKQVDEWGEHITIISWLPLDLEFPIDEFLVKLKCDTPIKPKEFLKMLIEKIGGELIV